MNKWIPWIALAVVVIIALGTLLAKDTEIYSTSYDGYGDTGGELYFAEDIAFESAPRAASNSFIDDGYYEESPSGDQSIIKTGYLSITVHHAEETANALNDVAEKYGGAVTNRSLNQYEGVTSGYVTLNVEEAQFETAILEIKALSLIVDSESVTADDVTETVIDLEARLSTAIAEETRYLEILGLADTVEDILLVERNLARVRTTIESYESQLNYYSQKTSFSTITVTLSEETSIEIGGVEFRPSQAVTNAIQTVVEIFQNLVISIIYIVIVGGAITIPVLIVLGAIRAWLKSRK